jgi:hypothetical protein
MFRALRETSIMEVVKNAVDSKGLSEFIKESNNAILKVKLDVDSEVEKTSFSMAVD